MGEPRRLSFVKPLDSMAGNYTHIIDRKDFLLIYMGEIANMPGHGIFIGHGTGKVYTGLHIDSFREATEDDL